MSPAARARASTRPRPLSGGGRDRGAALRTARRVWAGLLAGVGAALLLALAADRPEPEAPPAVATALGLVAVFQAVLADLLHRQATRSGPGRRRRAGAQPAGPAPGLAARLAAWIPDAVVAGYGLLLALLGFPPATWGGFGAVGVVLLVLHRPREGEGGA